MIRSISSLRVAATLALCAAAAAGSGCNAIGPAAIATGRAAYTDVITRTNDEQLLNTLVRIRYAETTSMLMVTAITSQSEMSLGSGLNVGIGQQRSYDGNLVPFSVDGSYRETPTISYEPISGAKYLKQLYTPIGLDLYGLLVDSAADTEAMLRLLTGGVGALDSPVQFESPRAADMDKALVLMAQLRRAGVLSFSFRMSDGGDVNGVDLVLDYATGPDEQKTSELLKLLGKSAPSKSDAPVHIPLQMGRQNGGVDGLRLQTRCTMELLQLAARGVQVPAAQLESGIAPAETPASAHPFVRVHSSVTEPEDPFVAVQYRGYWFWVQSNDIASKRGFVAMQTLLLSCLQGETGAGPQLSLPIN